MLPIILMYLGVGAIAGLLAGLLGVGGGLIFVPLLLFCFRRAGMPEDWRMHLALGTSMASIMFTSVSSFWAHHRRGAVYWLVVRRIVLGILAGTLLGAHVASRLRNNVLQAVFAVFVCYVAWQMLLDRKPKPSRELPGRWGMLGVGTVIGLISSLVGIGGGTMSVPFMIWCNLPLRRAIGTSAAIGFPIAVFGSVGYVLNGVRAPRLPPYALGYVYLPAMACIVAASVLTAPWGVRLSHRLPVPRLKRAFAALLVVVAARMLFAVVLQLLAA